jgi:hypothetical protein
MKTEVKTQPCCCGCASASVDNVRVKEAVVCKQEQSLKSLPWIALANVGQLF